MKLNLLFIAMDILTLLAYPIVFIYARVHLSVNSELLTNINAKLAHSQVLREYRATSTSKKAP